MYEKTLRTKIVKKLRSTYPHSYWFVTWGGPSGQQTGLPDIMGCCEGWFFGFEVKLPGKERTLTVRQKATLRAIEKAGGVAKMITSVDQALKIVRKTLA